MADTVTNKKQPQKATDQARRLQKEKEKVKVGGRRRVMNANGEKEVRLVAKMEKKMWRIRN